MREASKPTISPDWVCACGAPLGMVEVDSSRGIWHGNVLNVRLEWECVEHHRFVEFIPAVEGENIAKAMYAARHA